MHSCICGINKPSDFVGNGEDYHHHDGDSLGHHDDDSLGHHEGDSLGHHGENGHHGGHGNHGEHGNSISMDSYPLSLPTIFQPIMLFIH